ncbi:hypothetical protein [Peribacillus simplex]|uniref:hypothetical protein n=1 Tax=Peribacillus simplex TaxID=1478 RepID=UPI003D07FDB1
MKNWIIYSILLFLFFMWFPIIFYFTFMTWEFPNLYMEDNPWIGFIGGYFGAIFGGIVSGLFTFLGIRYTIKNNEKEKFLDTYDDKKLIVDEVIKELNKNFVNPQHLPTEEKIEFLIVSLPALNGLVNIIKNEIGGNIARKVSFLLGMHETITLKNKANLKHTSRKEIADTHFDYILTMYKDLSEYGEKLDDEYSKYKG